MYQGRKVANRIIMGKYQKLTLNNSMLSVAAGSSNLRTIPLQSQLCLASNFSSVSSFFMALTLVSRSPQDMASSSL